MNAQCPHCGKSYTLKPEAAGKTATCKQCGEKFVVRDDDTIPLKEELQPPAVPVMTPIRRERMSEVREVPIPPAIQNNTVIVQVPSRAGASLGISALVLGIVAFLICWIPFINMLGIPLSALGLLLGIVGAIVALWRRGSGIGYSIAGTAICGVALCVAFFINTTFVMAMDASAQALKELNKPPTVAKVAPEFPPAQGELPPLAKEAVVPGAGESKGPADAVEEGWVAADKPIQLEHIVVRVEQARIGKVPLMSLIHRDDYSWSSEDLCYIKISVENQSATKKVDYSTWGDDGGFLHMGGRLSDNFGNKYKVVTFSFDTAVRGATKSEALYPGKKLWDLLVFERPIENFENLYLELPGSRLGIDDGVFRIKIPASMIQQNSSEEKQVEPQEVTSAASIELKPVDEPGNTLKEHPARSAPIESNEPVVTPPKEKKPEKVKPTKPIIPSDPASVQRRKIEAAIKAIKLMIKQEDYDRAANAAVKALANAKGTGLEDEVRALLKEADAKK